MDVCFRETRTSTPSRYQTINLTKNSHRNQYTHSFSHRPKHQRIKPPPCARRNDQSLLRREIEDRIKHWNQRLIGHRKTDGALPNSLLRSPSMVCSVSAFPIRNIFGLAIMSRINASFTLRFFCHSSFPTFWQTLSSTGAVFRPFSA